MKTIRSLCTYTYVFVNIVNQYARRNAMVINDSNKKGARIKIQPRLNPISYEKPLK
jgi:hypothetical protein